MTTYEQMTLAKEVKSIIAGADTTCKNLALTEMAAALEADIDTILAANAQDLDAARGRISEVMLDRLALSRKRISDMAEGIRQVAQLPDPCNVILSTVKRPNGLIIEKTSVAMGVIAIIYESRPNVTSDAAALAVKAGSACILRAGKEAHRSAAAIVSALQRGLVKASLPSACIQLIEDTSRASATALMEARGLIDLLIPRGGKGLIQSCVMQAKVPVLETGTGICHIYVDRDADQEKALNIIENAKCSRPSVCNAAEQLLVHKEIAASFLPEVQKRLTTNRIENGLIPVELRLDKRAASFISGTPAEDQDFDTEFLDYIMAVSIVNNVDDAIAHIRKHSTGHSESVITENSDVAAKFTKEVDSAAVYLNASTRFTDGGEFGLGCEMGISTQKLHARGPLGLQELCSFKYIIHGNGQIR